MSKLETVKGVLKVFWKMTKEDFELMDHKFLRITVGIIGFIIAALFWYFIFSRIMPF